MKHKPLLALLIILVLIISGCGDSKSNGIGSTGNSNSVGNTEKSYSDMFTDRDHDAGYDKSKSAIIQLNGDTASCSSDAVQISGSTVTIIDEGTYILSGTLKNGMIIVNAEKSDKTQLVLNGVTINSETSAPIYILSADKVFITLEEGTSNTLSNGGSFVAVAENNIDATIFSKEDLTLNGSGTLTVDSPAGHGIISKDDLVFTNGTYIVNAASHGLDANDSVRVVNADIMINSGKDGVHAENSDDASLGFVYIASGTFQIAAEGDGLSAGAYMQIEGGSFDIVAGGGSENASKQTSDSWGMFGGGQRGGHGNKGNSKYSASSVTTEDDNSTSIKGMKAVGNLIINNGSFNIDSADDAVHSNASITVTGGNFEIASGDDAFHADETLSIVDGTINITKSYEGLEGLHVEISGGDISLVASDDGINAAGGTDQSGMGGLRGNDKFGSSSSSNGSISISNGSIYINASGDGIDANGSLEISGGTVTVCGPTSGDTAVLDYDANGIITGGTFIGTGAVQMAQTFSSSEQGVISIRANNQSAGTLITLKDESGNTLISHEPELGFSLIILSSPEIVKGQMYTVTVGSLSGEIAAN